MNKKQTAVDYLVEELIKFQIIEKKGPFTAPIIEKAKELEKEQIIDACDTGFEQGGRFPEDMTLKSSKHYYKETYGD